ncbi:MAG: hypothetical protein ACYTFT_12515, partial [Planctomycetota bacterium]
GSTFLASRTLTWTERSPDAAPPSLLARLDACWAAISGLALVEPVRCAALQQQHLRFALEAGDSFRVARALAASVLDLAVRGVGTGADARRFNEAAERACATSDEPYATALLNTANGAHAAFEGRFTRSLGHLDAALKTYRQRCAAVGWELTTTAWLMGWARHHAGEVIDPGGVLEARLEDAKRTDDRYGQALLRLGAPHARWLASHQIHAARAEIAAATAAWQRNEYDLIRHQAFVAAINTELYAGEPLAAWTVVRERWPEFADSLLAHARPARIEARFARGRAALALAARAGKGREQLLSIARKDADLLLKEEVAWSRALGELVQSGAALVDQGLSDAKAGDALRVAAEACDAAGLSAHGAAGRISLAELRQEPPRTADLEALARAGAREPVLYAQMLVPAFQ